MKEIQAIVFRSGRLRLLDQRKLPAVETYVECRGARSTARAIAAMVVRGAPAIGVAAAYGLALESRRFRTGRAVVDFDAAARLLLASRPTAVNIRWAVERLRPVLEKADRDARAASIPRLLAAEASRILAEDVMVNREIGRRGAALLRRRGAVLTHCNAGALATAGYGTALGVIRAAWEQGRRFEVYATETRPYLQGARLTSWELTRMGIPVTLITDSTAGHLFQSRKVAAVVVGTDRTAANGDVANKIGTYTMAVVAARHGVPFYVAAPTSSIDLDCKDGSAIPIEERDAREITHIGRRRVAPRGVSVMNPAFDVTPAELVTAIVTERGVVKGDFRRGLARVVAAAGRRK